MQHQEVTESYNTHTISQKAPAAWDVSEAHHTYCNTENYQAIELYSGYTTVGVAGELHISHKNWHWEE